MRKTRALSSMFYPLHAGRDHENEKDSLAQHFSIPFFCKAEMPLTAETEKQMPLEPWPCFWPIENSLPIIGPPTSFAMISTTATDVNSLAWYERSIREVVRPCKAGSSPSLRPQMNNAETVSA